MRVLEFALATAVISIIQLSFAFWIATVVGGRITELFETVINILL